METAQDIINKHKVLLKIPYTLKEGKSDLSENTKATVKKYGTWLRALECGDIPPYTEDQKKFSKKLYEGGVDPLHNMVVDCWLRYKKAIKNDKPSNIENDKPPSIGNYPPSNIEDYQPFKLENDQSFKLENDQPSSIGQDSGLFNEWQRRYDQGKLPSLTKSHSSRYEDLKSSSKTCPRCNGDGGAGGRCPICHGSGTV